ncbi:MAG: SseB family protein [Eubacterium sp.]|nr:SseB family protein [Eubacterium sp.]
MTISTSFMKKRIEKFDALFVLFSAFAQTPFIECDDDTFDDQVYAFKTEEMAKAFADSYSGRKIGLKVIRIEKKGFQAFFESLYKYGATTVMLQEEGLPVRVQLGEIVEKPDLKALQEDKVPQANPALQLTAIYYMQELRRPIERDKEEKQELHELEEEMVHNLFASRFIVVFDVSEVKGTWNPRDNKAPAKQQMLKLKNDKFVLPVFTELDEFRKYAARFVKPQSKVRLVPVPFDKLRGFLPGPASGFVVNPMGFNMVLMKERIEWLSKVYGTPAGEEES